jgi:hypothetical protein
MHLTKSELTTIKRAILTSKCALQEALDIAGRTKRTSLYTLLDWTVESLANQLDYVNEELTKQSVDSKCLMGSRLSPKKAV